MVLSADFLTSGSATRRTLLPFMNDALSIPPFEEAFPNRVDTPMEEDFPYMVSADFLTPSSATRGALLPFMNVV